MARIKHYDPEKQEWVYSDKAFAPPGGGGDYVKSVNGIEPDADGNVEIEASAQNVVNVKDYGATGDGVTDDTAAIAAAIADLNAGDTLYFPEGVYRVSNIDLKSDMTVRGEGWCSVIKLLDNTSGTHNNCLNMVGSRSNPIRNIIIRDIKLDGNRMTDGEYKQMSTGDSADQRLNGMHIRFASDIYAENVWMHNNGYHGCIMTYAENVVIQNCKSTDNGFRPIHGHTMITNCRVSNCVCENNGLGLQGGSGYENDSVFFFGAQNVAISGNLIKSNRRGCITVGTEQAGTAEADRLVTKNITISGNVCECYADLPEVSAGESDTGVRKFASMGIVVYGGTYGLENVAVTGNVIIRAQYGMHLYAEGGTASLNTTITGNAFMDCSDGILATNALDVTVSGNQFKGIKIMWIYGNNIRNFLVSGNNVNALGINQPFKIQNSADVAVLNNNIIGDKAHAIYVPASNTGCVVSGNAMYGFTLDNPVLNPNGYTANNVPGTEIPSDDHVNSLIDAKLGVIENGTY